MNEGDDELASRQGMLAKVFFQREDYPVVFTGAGINKQKFRGQPLEIPVQVLFIIIKISFYKQYV